MVGVQVKLAEAQSGPPTGKAFNLEVQGDDFSKMISAVEKIKKRIIPFKEKHSVIESNEEAR